MAAIALHRLLDTVFGINLGQSIGPDGASTLSNDPSKAVFFYSYLFAGHPKMSQQSCGSLYDEFQPADKYT